VSNTISNSCGGVPILTIPEYSVLFYLNFTSFLLKTSLTFVELDNELIVFVCKNCDVLITVFGDK
jgi:hypothetical protein